MLGYMAITVIAMLFTYTKLVNPESMVWGRIRVLFITAAMWAVYRMIPCRITKMARILAQLSLLTWWYPDTYEINRMFPNLDHVLPNGSSRYSDSSLHWCLPRTCPGSS